MWLTSPQLLGPCRRCHMVCIDQQTAVKNEEPFITLSKTRRIDGRVLFGQHAMHFPTKSRLGSSGIKVGDLVRVLTNEPSNSLWCLWCFMHADVYRVHDIWYSIEWSVHNRSNQVGYNGLLHLSGFGYLVKLILARLGRSGMNGSLSFYRDSPVFPIVGNGP